MSTETLTDHAKRFIGELNIANLHAADVTDAEKIYALYLAKERYKIAKADDPKEFIQLVNKDLDSAIDSGGIDVQIAENEERLTPEIASSVSVATNPWKIQLQAIETQLNTIETALKTLPKDGSHDVALRLEALKLSYEYLESQLESPIDHSEANQRKVDSAISIYTAKGANLLSMATEVSRHDNYASMINVTAGKLNALLDQLEQDPPPASWEQLLDEAYQAKTMIALLNGEQALKELFFQKLREHAVSRNQLRTFNDLEELLVLLENKIERLVATSPSATLGVDTVSPNSTTGMGIRVTRDGVAPEFDSSADSGGVRMKSRHGQADSRLDGRGALTHENSRKPRIVTDEDEDGSTNPALQWSLQRAKKNWQKLSSITARKQAWARFEEPMDDQEWKTFVIDFNRKIEDLSKGETLGEYKTKSRYSENTQNFNKRVINNLFHAPGWNIKKRDEQCYEFYRRPISHKGVADTSASPNQKAMTVARLPDNHVCVEFASSNPSVIDYAVTNEVLSQTNRRAMLVADFDVPDPAVDVALMLIANNKTVRFDDEMIAQFMKMSAEPNLITLRGNEKITGEQFLERLKELKVRLQSTSQHDADAADHLNLLPFVTPDIALQHEQAVEDMPMLDADRADPRLNQDGTLKSETGTSNSVAKPSTRPDKTISPTHRDAAATSEVDEPDQIEVVVKDKRDTGPTRPKR